MTTRALLAAVIEQTLADIFQTACGPYSRIASVFCISTALRQRKHSTRNSSLGTSDNRRCSIGSHGLPAARRSARTLSHHSAGSGWSGVGEQVSGTVWSRSRANFSICLGLGIRHDAG